MNREILFRGWNEKNSKWLYGCYFINRGKHYIVEDGIQSPFATPEDFQVEESSIGQYTGLKDKNGKKVFEGDIVKWGHTDNARECPPRVAVVEIAPDLQFKCLTPTEHAFGHTGYVFGFGSFAYEKTEKYLEIIGNVHNNPELLKGGEE